MGDGTTRVVEGNGAGSRVRELGVEIGSDLGASELDLLGYQQRARLQDTAQQLARRE